jgi:hypothetical protein
MPTGIRHEKADRVRGRCIRKGNISSESPLRPQAYLYCDCNMDLRTVLRFSGDIVKNNNNSVSNSHCSILLRVYTTKDEVNTQHVECRRD